MAKNNTTTERPAGPPTAADLRADADRLSEIGGLMRSSAALVAALTAERDRLRAALWEASSIVAGIAVDHPRLGGVKSIELCDSVREPLGGWHPDHDS